jgi:bacillithiol biosynthesis cysteine-adding enzyme BshC
MIFQRKQTVPFSETKLLPRLVQDYLAGNCKWLTGYENDTAFDYVTGHLSANRTVNREKLVSALKEQNISPTEKQQQNIEALLSESSFTVTTGHQLNLFTGPLYFIYKIVTAINLAEQLNGKYSNKHFVPVYWMASEDHDIDEINHVFLYGKKIEWRTEQQGAAGRLKCSGIEAVIDEVQKVLGVSENANAITGLLRRCYAEKHTLSEATRLFVDHLFGKYGLLILDADDASLKEEFNDVMQDDLKNSTAFKLVNSTISRLEEKSYEVQVRPREINLFYLADKNRLRIVKENTNYFGLDKEGNKKALSSADLSKSVCLSPNVALRPLYQETVLPNVAYVGGPAEIAYWLEYKSVFDNYGVSYPVLVLRNSVMIVERAVAGKIEKLGLSTKDLFASLDELSKQYVLRNDHQFTTATDAGSIEKIFGGLKKRVEEVDVTLSSTVEAEMQKHLNSLKALEEKVIRAGKRKHETSIQQIQKIKERLFPNGKLAERIENFLQYYVKYGDAFISSLMESIEPMNDSITILEEK